MKTKNVLVGVLLALSSTGVGPLHAQTNAWRFEVSLYGLAAGMSGQTAVKGIPGDVDVGFDKIWDHLHAGGMGTARVGYERWALSTDVIYLDVEAHKNNLKAEAKQWLVQPQVEYTFCQYCTAYAGARYYNIHLELNGPLGVNPSDRQSWWDPVIGTQLSTPVWKKLSFNVRGDIGGFGLGSDLSWQAYPYVNWQFSKIASLQMGYRFISVDYQTGSGLNRFKYDVLIQGPQIGFTLSF